MGSTKIATVSNNQVRFYFQDHLGSTNVVTDAIGTAIELIEYKPFGELARHEKYGGTENTAWYYFTGKPLDDETGLMFYGARYYSPLIGRFITPDTIVQSPMNPQTLNRYSYCNNNPVNFIDPTGHFWFVPFIIAAVKGAVIGATLGAATAAITGGNIGQGALFGAIGGAVFAGMGSIVQNAVRYATIPGGIGPMTAGATFTSNVMSSVLGGAVSGAAGSAYLGTDPLNGAGIGALSGGLFGGISRMPGTGWGGAGRVALAGIAGGGISEIAGGSFADGATFAGIITGSDFIYRSILSTQPQGKNVGASMKTARENGLPKLDAKGNPLMVDNKPIVLNDPKVSNVGLFSKAGDTGLLNSIAGESGPIMSSLGRFAPGFQGLSLSHDIVGSFLSSQVGGTINTFAFNFQTMPICYGLNAAGSLVNDSPGMIGFYEAYQEER